ncbi:MAG TPA: class I SAM-dependent methyltransferase [Mycobacteriales bacterium]|nr:class I SAM-dependent methyltransferase [Mycobacteriales bacterium]
MRERRTVLEAARHAARYPQRARWYLHRLRRDAMLRLSHRDHLAYYGAVVDDLVTQGKATAVGDIKSRRSRRVGKLQFDYLVRHGLQPHHRVLEIGCGNLRAGWRIIRYLDAEHYFGIDISQQALRSAQRNLVERGLVDKRPHLELVRDQTYSTFPDAVFDVVHAHSVFSHAPLDVIEDCFAHVGRIMKPDGFFDFTFKRTEGKEYGKLREDFYYRTETLIAAAARHGLSARFMDDWEALGHSQSKLRVTLPPASGRPAA